MKNKLLSFVPQNQDCDFVRIERLQDKMYHRKATLCAERAEIYTEVFQKTEGEAMVLRKAKAFHETLSRMSIYIEPDSLIVGNQACRNFAAPIFPEYSIDWIVEEMDEFEKRSGDSFFVDEESGHTYQHIMDPKTGRPAESDLASVSIVTKNGMLGDGLSTSLYIMGLEKSIEYWRTHADEFDFILIGTDGKIYISDGLSGRIASDTKVQVIVR